MTLDHFNGEIRHKHDCHYAVIKEKEEHLVTFLISKERGGGFFGDTYLRYGSCVNNSMAVVTTTHHETNALP